MTAEDFTKLFLSEKQDLLKSFTTVEPETLVFSLVKQMGLTHDQQTLMKKVIDAVLSEGMTGFAMLKMQLYRNMGVVSPVSRCVGDIKRKLSKQPNSHCRYDPEKKYQ